MKLIPALYAMIALTFLITTTGCSSFKRNPASDTVGKHYIMTLHGVRGNEQSYGQFHEVIEAHLEKIDPAYDVVPLNITYKTGQPDYTPTKAAAEINAKLDSLIPDFGPHDKISVVAYSMGGQVGLAWYFNSLRDEAHKKYPLQTAKFISLGAAYWGAQEPALLTSDIDLMKRTIKASILEINLLSQQLIRDNVSTLGSKTLATVQNYLNTNYIFPVVDKLKSIEQIQDFYDNRKVKDFAKYDLGKSLDSIEALRSLRHSTIKDLSKISFAELQALSIAGSVETELRLNMMNHANRTKWVSISTLVQCFETDLGTKSPGCDDFQYNSFSKLNKAFAKYTFGLVRRETDNAVITPSSNVQFLYAAETNADYTDGHMTPSTAFRYSVKPENHKIIFAETLHATLVTESIYQKALGYLGKLGQSWTRLADDVVIVHKNKCETPDKCDHPVYKFELEELADCDRPDSTCDQNQFEKLVGTFQMAPADEKKLQDKLTSELHGFSLELNIRLPKGYDQRLITETNIMDYIRMQFEKESQGDRVLTGSADQPYKIQIGRKLELNSILIKKMSFANQDQLKVNFTGLIVPKPGTTLDYESLKSGTTLQFAVTLPGLKTRRVDALVRPYHSTYVDLMMAKK
ncbi:MAG: hypothetical protein A2622_10070 [Bdellovibrionales bacterium RIFCSPHIGHO2_01_FULL_40_29]|nr:MAG: hypothetical protein A2622_10070 [Bdellovibrionales bacterium RIFCSPHIGHO2_01_FULL_40_29]OFZ32407.1 MAG: hypothetical protein A3D17_12590 [Bdellovibrionales bacterium RIFCSPHIGHO2_02_FULL_40_15]